MARDPITLTQLLAALRGQVEVLEQRGDMNCPVHAITDDSRAVMAWEPFCRRQGRACRWSWIYRAGHQGRSGCGGRAGACGIRAGTARAGG